MKRNAMLRIVLWSLLALILLGILLTGLFGYVGRNSYRFDHFGSPGFCFEWPEHRHRFG